MAMNDCYECRKLSEIRNVDHWILIQLLEGHTFCQWGGPSRNFLNILLLGRNNYPLLPGFQRIQSVLSTTNQTISTKP